MVFLDDPEIASVGIRDYDKLHEKISYNSSLSYILNSVKLDRCPKARIGQQTHLHATAQPDVFLRIRKDNYVSVLCCACTYAFIIWYLIYSISLLNRISDTKKL